MGSGREGGSPSASAMVFATKQVISPSMLMHKLQREELLGDGSRHNHIDKHSEKSNPDTRSRTPGSGNTPLHSPRSMSPLRSLSSTEILSTEIASATMVDFQKAILRASHVQKNFIQAETQSFQGDSMDFQMQKAPSRISMPAQEEENEASPVLTMAVTRSRSEMVQAPVQVQPQQRQRSPFLPGRGRLSELDMDQEAHAPPVRSMRRTDALAPTSSDWVGRGKSPRRSKVSSTTGPSAAIGDDTHETVIEQRKSGRSSSRRSKVEVSQDLAEADLGMGDANRVTRRTHTRPHTRQHKRKASDPITVISGPSSPPESYAAHRSPPLHPRQQVAQEYPPPPYRIDRHFVATSSPSASSRRASRGGRVIASSDWLQFIGDIIMWRHIPRSSLLFGAGCFCIMSASLIQDMKCSPISVVAYVALFYLATRFIKCNFLRSSYPALSVAMVTEADALSLVRMLLPPFNAMLQNLGALFSGEPIVTLKVAGALWFLAWAGSIMNMWTLAKIAYFALFTLPKLYSNYNPQIHGQARKVLHWMLSTWGACSHKKAVLIGVFAVAWNFSSLSTRVCGAFLGLVGVRAYKHFLR